MEWAKTIFLKDTGLESWSISRKKFGLSIDQNLRTYASTLKKEVKSAELKNIKARPVVYKEWFNKITTKVVLI